MPNEQGNIHVERINITGKQILVVHGICEAELDRLYSQIREWLQSDHPILILNLPDGAETRLEKVEC